MNGSSFIKEIGRSYLVSSFLPAALFISLGWFLFKGFIPQITADGLVAYKDLFGGRWVFMLIFILWVAFYLYSTVDWTVRFFEGYLFPLKIQNVMTKSLRKNWHAMQAPNYIELQGLRKGRRTRKKDRRFIEIKPLALAELHELEVKSPVDEANLLPTRLGNVLRASEIYPNERYHLEGITIWPRLFQVLPPAIVQQLEEKNNHLIFLLNSSLLIYINAMTSLIVGALGLPCQVSRDLSFCYLNEPGTSFIAKGYLYITPIEFILIGIALIEFGYILYSISISTAEHFGLFVRTGFDLYRFDLLKQLNQKMPENLDEEKITWEVLSEYLIAGNQLGLESVQMDYYHYGGPSDPNKSEP